MNHDIGIDILIHSHENVDTYKNHDIQNKSFLSLHKPSTTYRKVILNKHPFPPDTEQDQKECLYQTKSSVKFRDGTVCGNFLQFHRKDMYPSKSYNTTFRS
jgi:hypothetical protein